MKTDNQKIKELIRLSDENPDLPIIPMVATEIVAEDSFAYWMGSIGESRKDIILNRNEYITIGHDDIFDFLYEELENNTYDKELTEDEIKELTDARIEELKSWKDIYEAIIVYIELP